MAHSNGRKAISFHEERRKARSMGTVTGAPKVSGTARRTAKATVAKSQSNEIELSDEQKERQRRLKPFGFVVTDEAILKWTVQQDQECDATLDQWTEDQRLISTGEPVPLTERSQVPKFLVDQEAVKSDQIIKASEEGRKTAANIDLDSEHNPYPPGTLLAGAWNDAFIKNLPRAEESESAEEATTGAPPDLTKPANAVELATKAKPETHAELQLRKAEAQRTAILDLQDEMEFHLLAANKFTRIANSLKDDLKEAKASAENASKKAMQAAADLAQARNGFFDSDTPQKTLPTITPPFEGNSHEVDSPPKPAVDEGAFVSLDHLVKKDIQEFIPGTNEDVGISQKQADVLKELVDGEMIGDLEKWMKSKGEYWAKEMRDSGKGLGKETITKIQDAHEVIRRKFPIPDLDATRDETAATVVDPVKSDVPVHEPMPVADADNALDELIQNCSEVERDITNAEGIRFVRSVAKQAKDMLESLDGKSETTAEQTRAIRNWEAAVAKWLDSDFDDEDFPDNDE